MLHLLYILSFTILAFIAVSNLIRNLVSFSLDRERSSGGRAHSGFYGNPLTNQDRRNRTYSSSHRDSVPHPELLDSSGKLIKEPLLVMRSINVEDARQQLDALYDASPAHKLENQEEI
ncbi:MAG: DUF2973 domain-containing protein [Calothrix sp. MO_167.B12]|nr:DUF2973 domain-containing protein [Calothrix sp. MO_167.B12]